MDDRLIDQLAEGDRSALQQVLATVRDLMSTELVTLEPEHPVGEAINAFARGRFRHILVTKGDRLVGVLSDRDVLRFFARRGGASGGTISEMVTVNPRTIDPSASIAEATRLMLQHRINCLPVTDGGGAVVGILTTTDLLRALYATHHWLERRVADAHANG